MGDTDECYLDQFAPPSSSCDRADELHDVTEQLVLQQDEKIVSDNPSAAPGASRTANGLPVTSETSDILPSTYRFDSYTPQEKGYPYGGGNGSWDESNYVSSNKLHVAPQAMYNDNSSFFFHLGDGFDSQMAYGQYGQPFSTPHMPVSTPQMPVSVPYYPTVTPSLSHATSPHTAPQTELLLSGSCSRENLIENATFSSGSGYYQSFGSFDERDLSNNNVHGLQKFPSEFGSSEPQSSQSISSNSSKFISPLTSGNACAQSNGIVGSYEQKNGQGSGIPSNSVEQSPNGEHVGYGCNWIQFTYDKEGKCERDQAVNNSSDTFGTTSICNRGPRASKPKCMSIPHKDNSSCVKTIKAIEPISGVKADRFNSDEFVTDYKHARYFVIKSFSEDNIHRSIKYNVWTSTPPGNRKLDAAYCEAKETEGFCPVFLFFSVNASGQFCGVAEMVGPVDFENDADYWKQDRRWSGQFPIKWHIIKDIPNRNFTHILLENNDNKPVTHSRDTQEVKLQQGIEMLKIFKGFNAATSLLNDFNFYNEKERCLMERKAKQLALATENTSVKLATESLNQLCNDLPKSLHLDDDEILATLDPI